MYRYKMTKDSCLIRACIATIALILFGLVTFALWFRPEPGGRGTAALALFVLAADAGIWWYRWFAYDKN